jgi:hypothetical protein
LDLIIIGLDALIGNSMPKKVCLLNMEFTLFRPKSQFGMV